MTNYVFLKLQNIEITLKRSWYCLNASQTLSAFEGSKVVEEDERRERHNTRI